MIELWDLKVYKLVNWSDACGFTKQVYFTVSLTRTSSHHNHTACLEHRINSKTLTDLLMTSVTIYPTLVHTIKGMAL